MTAPSLSDASGVPAAINAFLRGAERRGAVFAELQCGDAVAGDAALAAAMRAFQANAAKAPMGEWPHRFWSLLLATPRLRQATALPARADAFGPLARIGHGPRAALLLRLAAGLGETEAAAALGIAPATYRLALQRALPRRADGSADETAWRALAVAAQAAIKQLPPQRLAHLAKLRESALRPAERGRAAPVPQEPVDAPKPRHGWRIALWASAVACAGAFAATFLWPTSAPREPSGAPDIRTVSLPDAEAPASRYDAEWARLSDRDFDLLLDARDEAVYRDLDFYAWYAAQAAMPASERKPGDPGVPETAPDEDRPETSDATL